MYCTSCGLRFNRSSFIFCSKCSQLLCHICQNDHKHAELQKDDVIDVGQLTSFFQVEATECTSLCRNKHDKSADYFCEICQEFICHSCLTFYHQHSKKKRLQKYSDQIQNALTGCETMILSKESNLERAIKNLKQKEAEKSLQIRKAEEAIRFSSQEMLFKVAMAIQKREKFLRNRYFSAFQSQLKTTKKTIENIQSFLDLFKKAKQVVTKMKESKTIPTEKDLFFNLSAMNRLDLSFLTASNPDDDIKPLKILKLPENKIDEMCQTLLRFKERKVRLNGNPKTAPANCMNKTEHNISFLEEDVISIGETDEELGEFFIVSDPVKVQGITGQGKQVLRGPSFLQELNGTSPLINGFRKEESYFNQAEKTRRDDTNDNYIHNCSELEHQLKKTSSKETQTLKSISHSALNAARSKLKVQDKDEKALRSRSTGSIYKKSYRPILSQSEAKTSSDGRNRRFITNANDLKNKGSVGRTPTEKKINGVRWQLDEATRGYSRLILDHHSLYHKNDHHISRTSSRKKQILRTAKEQVLNNPKLKFTLL
ncbi:uncharacterized protein LOC143446408 [Clavelina lepadiformis]|uniref:uncharacterized protein LOC143446406 n=1 Tax=Clavelina lepadiformis TaxID=159417 RepID=UPI004041559C